MTKRMARHAYKIWKFIGLYLQDFNEEYGPDPVVWIRNNHTGELMFYAQSDKALREYFISVNIKPWAE